VLNDAFVVKVLRVIGGKFGPFVAFPSEKGKNVTICFPILQTLHEEMSRTILTEYWRVLFLSQKGKEEQAG